MRRELIGSRYGWSNYSNTACSHFSTFFNPRGVDAQPQMTSKLV
jgi:hypothetical protein